MSRPSPTTFETDMAILGKRAGVDPIPKQVTSRPEPGEYGGIYDEKKPVVAPAEAAPVVENRQMHAEPQAHGSGYQTRGVRKTTKAEVEEDKDV